MPPSEADRWREEALINLKRANAYLQVLLRSAYTLIELTEIHKADDFGHCCTCGDPWPCRTAEVVKTLALMFQERAE